MTRKTWVVFFILALGNIGCSQVKPWEKEVLSLDPMSIDDCAIHRFERNFEVYREGAVGGNGGKSGGGCGCS